MSPFWGQLAGALILFMMIAFIGIWLWAWNARHHSAFHRMSQLPMEDDAVDAHGRDAQP